MANYRTHGRTRGFGLPKRVWMLLFGIVVLSLAGVFIAHNLYNKGLGPVSTSQQTQIFTVKQGTTVKQIAQNLEDEKLIRSAWAMELYVHSKELTEKLQAGTYALSPSDGTPKIIKTMSQGVVATRLVTILPGQRIDQVRASLINDGFSPDAVDAALVPSQYSDLPALAIKPANVNTLEGLLWPDSFQKDPTTSPEVIIRESLVAMGEHLTPDIQASFARQGLTTYQGVTLASILIQEVNKPADQSQAAQVFYKRLKSDMVLGSDVTARYGAIAAGRAPSLTYESPYNTLKVKGLPPSPISTISQGALNAAANPAATDWLYFVAGDDGVTHFSKTFEEHEALADKYCHKLCGR
jgi:UPF0755 protein